MNTVWSEPLPMRVTTSASGERAPVGRVEASAVDARHASCSVRARRIGQVAGELLDHRRQRAHGRDAERRARRRRVDVEIGHRLGLQLGGELLAPLGGSGERHFLAVPAAEDQRAPRPDAVAGEPAERRRQLHHRRRAAGRIDAAEHPGVVVVAEHDPLVGPLAAADAALDDVVGLHVGLHVDLHAQPGGAAEPVGERAAPPFHASGAGGPPSASRIGWMSRCDIGSAITLGIDTASDGGDPPRARGGRPAGRQRITRHDVVVGDAAALQVAGRSPRAAREHLALAVAVLGRIRVDDHRRRAFTFGGERLEPAVAVRVRVAHDDDLALAGRCRWRAAGRSRPGCRCWRRRPAR